MNLGQVVEYFEFFPQSANTPLKSCAAVITEIIDEGDQVVELFVTGSNKPMPRIKSTYSDIISPGKWRYYPAPDIVVNDITANDITANDITANSLTLPVTTVVQSFAFNGSGGSTPFDGSLVFSLVAGVVTVRIPPLTGTSRSGSTWFRTLLPAAYQPVDTNGMIMKGYTMRNNGLEDPNQGAVQINGGYIYFYRTIPTSTFTNSSSCGLFYGTCLTYPL